MIRHSTIGLVGIRPSSGYLQYIERAKLYAKEKGVEWHVQYDMNGKPYPDRDWDLRKLCDSHERHRVSLGSFEVVDEIRIRGLEVGWAVASLPVSDILCEDVIDFIKAVVVERCREKKNVRACRTLAFNLKLFFSSTTKMAWEVSEFEVARYLELPSHSQSVSKDIARMCHVINVNLLSSNCPIEVVASRSERWGELHQSLDARIDEGKLPDRKALYELVRIIFRETPASYLDRIRFAALKILIFTGLRINEVLRLPADCLVWESHVDVVTGLPAGEVGGVSRSLSIKYFAEKHPETSSDSLVEEMYWVPQKFEKIISEAVSEVLIHSVRLRNLLAAQLNSAVAPEHTDRRLFNTTSGAKIGTCDLLFLQPRGGRVQPSECTIDTPIVLLNQNSIYLALGLQKGKKSSSLFGRYSEVEFLSCSVKPHSLRHLLNTELFRSGVPDTVITQQFGRISVAQSYEYDHRTLAEHLQFVKLPPIAHEVIESGSVQELVAKMIVGGVSPKSSISMTFAEIQRASGDLAAFRYLCSAADGFHVTPYGFCLNSFSLSPCPKYLKCFDGCKHFAASGMPEHIISLQKLRENLLEMRRAAESRSVNTVGRMNQIKHANALIAGVDAALIAQPNLPVFSTVKNFSQIEGDIFK